MNQAEASQARRLVVACVDNLGLESQVCEHFGRCPTFAVVEADGTTIRSCRNVENPYAANHAPGDVAEFIFGLGSDVVVTGGLGARATAFFDNRGVEVVTVAAGNVRSAVDSYLHGERTGAAPCAESHDHHHRHQLHAPEDGGRD